MTEINDGGRGGERERERERERALELMKWGRIYYCDEVRKTLIMDVHRHPFLI